MYWFEVAKNFLEILKDGVLRERYEFFGLGRSFLFMGFKKKIVGSWKVRAGFAQGRGKWIGSVAGYRIEWNCALIAMKIGLVSLGMLSSSSLIALFKKLLGAGGIS